MLRAIFLILILPTLVYGAGREESDRVIHTGQQTLNLQDSVKVVGAGADTSRVFWLGAVDLLAVFVKYDNRADSINVTVDLDIAPSSADEKGLFGSDFVYYGTLTRLVQTGTADSLFFQQVAVPPIWARYGRLRVTASMAATDSVLVTTKIIKTYLDQ